MTLVKISCGIILLQLWTSLFTAAIRRRAEYVWYILYLLASTLLLPFTLEAFYENYSDNFEINILLVSFLSYIVYWKFYGVLFKIGRGDGILFYLLQGIIFFYVIFIAFMSLFGAAGYEKIVHDGYLQLGWCLLLYSCLIYYLTFASRDKVLVYLVVLSAVVSDVVSLIGAQYLVDSSPLIGTRVHYFSCVVECLFFSIALIYNTSKSEKAKLLAERNLAKERLNTISSQLNFHFIANSLNIVYRFLLNQEGDAATFYFLKFSHLLRTVLNHSREEFVTVAGEVDVLKLYLEMEALRFQHTFSYLVEIQDSSLAERTKIPPFLIHPLLENAIHHGLLPRKEGRLLLAFHWEANWLKIIVEDNGIGRAAAAEGFKKSVMSKTSLGLSIVEERLHSLPENPAGRASLTFEDLHDPNGIASGTRAQIAIPLILSR